MNDTALYYSSWEYFSASSVHNYRDGVACSAFECHPGFDMKNTIRFLQECNISDMRQTRA